MYIHTKHLYGVSRFSVPRLPRHVILILLGAALMAPFGVLGDDPSYEQEFVITAYYSPEPDQCCYVKGGYRADVILNGEGHTTADGTAVRPGIIAAPPQYPFGTRVALPGLGTFTVHDRGGAIQILADNTHRLDLWVGSGEEGLARALAFGVRRVKGTVHPLGSDQPREDVAFDRLAAPLSRLEAFLLPGTDLPALRPGKGERSLSARILQERLREVGYFAGEPTGFYGPETEESLAAFLRDFKLAEPADRLTEKAAAYLLAAVRRKAAEFPVEGFVDRESAQESILQAQRILRFLGYYAGRTDGRYGDALFQAILAFQQEHRLAGDASSPGAGRIGPITKRVLEAAWNRLLVAKRAQRYLALARVESYLEEGGRGLARFLGEGDAGPDVRLLQTLLSERGFFPAEKVNGNFGPLTRASVLAYQRSQGIVEHAEEAGAGTVGPMTLAALRKEEKIKLYHQVLAEGWNVL